MNVMNDKYSVTAFEDNTYSRNSADNIPYDFEIYAINTQDLGCDFHYSTYRVIIEKFDDASEAKIIVICHYCTNMEYHGMILEDDTLIMLLDSSIVTLSLCNMSYKIKNIPMPFGTYYSIYSYKDKYIIYGEIEVMMLDSDFNELWRYCTSDILVNLDYKIKIDNDCISFYDLDGNFHKLDMSGKLCEYIKHEPKIITLDLTNVETPNELQILIKKNFAVPHYYGGNWNAFWDIIEEIMPDKLILEGWHIYKSKQPKDAILFEQILDDYNKMIGTCECVYLYYN